MFDADAEISEREKQRRRETERLGSDAILPLVLRLSLPAMVGLLVSSLYVFVDRAFIGNYVGTTGMAAMNGAQPLATIIFAVSILIARGCAVMYSISLGRRDYAKASHVCALGLALYVAASVVITAVGLMFTRPLLHAFGVPASALALGVEYISVSLFGTLFAMMSMHSHLIRAEGKSTYAMLAQCSGALLNVALDWLFMARFGWGMAGAAYATVISQAVAAAAVWAFFLGGKSVSRVTWRAVAESLRALRLLGQVMLNGLTPFIFNFVATITSIIQNHTVRRHGVGIGHTEDAALAVFGILASLNHLVHTPALGLAMGMQPLVGYNISAGHYRRVRHIFMRTLCLSFVLLLIPFALIETFPAAIMWLFGERDPEVVRLGVYTIRRYMMLIPLGGVVVLFSQYFQGTGQAGKAMIIASIRQAGLILPLVIVLPLFFGYDGVVFAIPIGELLGMFFGIFFMAHEYRRLRRLETQAPLFESLADPARVAESPDTHGETFVKTARVAESAADEMVDRD